ncbi:MAG: hypothetical protein JJ900_12170 [Rhodospirillales bacterium]|nr:hypothetical protein [Rhodospirillales bacterium]MBO6787599.1 hypothetical protein [Rhodospirillales bacterium]
MSESESEFEHGVTIDANGILVVRFAGVFDVEKWADRALDPANPANAGGFDPERPIVVDLTFFAPPPTDWPAGARRVISVIKKRGERRGRRALVVGENIQARIAANFFIKFKEVVAGKSEGLRIFTSFDEGYAWATEGWQRPV